MNKKEVLEIRKQFKPDNCTISKICGCYVDGEKIILLKFREAFGSLSDEECFKYFVVERLVKYLRIFPLRFPPSGM